MNRSLAGRTTLRRGPNIFHIALCAALRYDRAAITNLCSYKAAVALQGPVRKQLKR